MQKRLTTPIQKGTSVMYTSESPGKVYKIKIPKSDNCCENKRKKMATTINHSINCNSALLKVENPELNPTKHQTTIKKKAKPRKTDPTAMR